MHFTCINNYIWICKEKHFWGGAVSQRVVIVKDLTVKHIIKHLLNILQSMK